MRRLAIVVGLLLAVSASADGPQVNQLPTGFLALPLVFCGQGANATTNYFGPGAAWSTDLTPGGAACDALDNTTEATADAAPYGIDIAYTVVGMYCTMTDTGTDDTVTFTLRDDTASVTGFTCTTAALDGAGTNGCRVYPAPQTIGAGSAMAIQQVRSETGGADDLSASDAICYVFTRL